MSQINELSREEQQAVDQYIYSVNRPESLEAQEQQEQVAVAVDDALSDLTPEERKLASLPVPVLALIHIAASPLDGDTKIGIMDVLMRRYLPLLELEPVHRFSDGLYLRELTIPAGTLITSVTHKTDHAVMCSQGAIAVWSEENGLKFVQAPMTAASEAGHRRIGFALEDTVWTTIFPNPDNCTDIDELERRYHLHPDLSVYEELLDSGTNNELELGQLLLGPVKFLEETGGQGSAGGGQ